MGRPDKAVTDFSEAVKFDRNYADAFFGLGNALVADASQATNGASANLLMMHAISAYSRAIEVNPKLWTALINRGKAYVIVQQYKPAIADFTRVIESKDGPRAMGYYNRAVAHEALAVQGNKDTGIPDHKQAILDATHAIDLTSGRDTKARHVRALCYRALGNLPSAILDYDQLTKDEKSDPDNWYNLSLAHYNMGNHLAEGLYDISIAIKLKPDMPKYHQLEVLYRQRIHAGLPDQTKERIPHIRH